MSRETLYNIGELVKKNEDRIRLAEMEDLIEDLYNEDKSKEEVEDIIYEEFGGHFDQDEMDDAIGRMY